MIVLLVQQSGVSQHFPCSQHIGLSELQHLYGIGPLFGQQYESLFSQQSPINRIY